MDSDCPKSGQRFRKLRPGTAICLLVLYLLQALPVQGADPVPPVGTALTASDHFDGNRYFNPSDTPASPEAQAAQRRRSGWIWRWVFGTGWPEWPDTADAAPGSPPAQLPNGALRVTSVGHATFLIQMDGLNLLTDPIWEDRCAPVSWAGPKRHRAPGIRFEELPAIDAILISHNHYDHLDLPTLKRFAKNGVPRAIVPLGDRDLVLGTGITAVDELDWWQSVRLSADVTLTVVPAQHFSSRTLWDRNETLWGGFVISGPSGNVYYSGDTGYGAHFREIARRFSPLRVAILPISPFTPRPSNEPPHGHAGAHMGPAEAVQAHLDLGAGTGIAAHFQVFQLGADGFDDALNELAAALKAHGLRSGDFIAPLPGQSVTLPAGVVAPPLAGTGTVN